MTERQTDGRTDRQTDGRTTDGQRTDGRTDGRASGRTDDIKTLYVHLFFMDRYEKFKKSAI